MASLWGRRIGNIRTPMLITNAELSSISAAPVTNNAVELLRSSERTMPVAMRLPTPICQEAREEEDPNDSGGPTHAGVRANDWRRGRVVGGGFPVQKGH